MSGITVATATPEVIDVIDRWHRFMRGDMPDALEGLLDDEVVLYSPVVFTPQRGKPMPRFIRRARAEPARSCAKASPPMGRGPRWR
jgi:hypothetical protein